MWKSGAKPSPAWAVGWTLTTTTKPWTSRSWKPFGGCSSNCGNRGGSISRTASCPTHGSSTRRCRTSRPAATIRTCRIPPSRCVCGCAICPPGWTRKERRFLRSFGPPRPGRSTATWASAPGRASSMWRCATWPTTTCICWQLRASPPTTKNRTNTKFSPSGRARRCAAWPMSRFSRRLPVRPTRSRFSTMALSAPKTAPGSSTWRRHSVRTTSACARLPAFRCATISTMNASSPPLFLSSTASFARTPISKSSAPSRTPASWCINPRWCTRIRSARARTPR